MAEGLRAEDVRARIFMIPTAIKRNRISADHTEADIDRTLETARDVLNRTLPGA